MSSTPSSTIPRSGPWTASQVREFLSEARIPPRCAFEIAPNEPPYFGVRGQATASLESAGARELLERLLDRYVGTTDSKLGRFLLGRADEELVVRLKPEWIGTWDYRERMEEV
jgi:hypothetical protein